AKSNREPQATILVAERGRPIEPASDVEPAVVHTREDVIVAPSRLGHRGGVAGSPDGRIAPKHRGVGCGHEGRLFARPRAQRECGRSTAKRCTENPADDAAAVE